MTQYIKLVNGEPVPMTEKEIAARQAEEAAWEAGRALRAWERDIAATDAKMPRFLEDLLDRDGIDGLPQALVDAYNKKETTSFRKTTIGENKCQIR